MADNGPEYVIKNKFRPGTLESEAWRKFSLQMGRLGVQLESSLIILFAVQKTITIFAEKGGKSEICVVQSISVGESSFFLLYIVLAASS